MQAECTATAKAQLTVEEARNQGCRLDIELEQAKAGAATAKSAANSARHASRLLDLDKRAAIAELKQTAAARTEADSALVQVDVVSPAPCIKEEEPAGY